MLVGEMLIGQTDTKLNYPFKFDSIVSIKDSNQVLVYHKLKSGVYDFNKKKFVVPMTKGHIQYLENSGRLFKIEKGNINSLYPFSKSGWKFNLTKMSVTGEEEPDVKNAYLDAVEIIAKDWIIVTQCLFPVFRTFPKNHDFMDYEMTDEIYISYPIREDGAAKSGLFDINKRTWLIPPNYSKVERVGNSIIAYRNIDDAGRYFVGKTYAKVDVFRINGQTISWKNQIEINEHELDWSDLLKDALEVEKVERYHESSNKYKLYKSGKEKLISFHMDYDFEFVDYFPFQWFELVEMRNEDMIVYDKEIISHYKYYQNSKELLLDGSSKDNIGILYTEHLPGININHYVESDEFDLFNITKGDVFYYYTKTNNKRYISFGFERNKNQMVVNHRFPEFKSEFPLITDFGEDSIIVNEKGFIEYVYPPADPGSYRSGVYDLETKRWIIPQKHWSIQAIGDKYLTLDYKLNENNVRLSEETFQALFDNKGNLLLSHEQIAALSFDEIVSAIFSNCSVEFAHFQKNPKDWIATIGRFSGFTSLIYKIEDQGVQRLIQFDFGANNRIIAFKEFELLKGQFVDGSIETSSGFESVLNFAFVLDDNKPNLFFSHVSHAHEKIKFEKLSLEAKNFELILHESYNQNSKDADNQIYFLVQFKGHDQPNANYNFYAYTHIGEHKELKQISSEQFHEYLSSQEFKEHRYERQDEQMVVMRHPEIYEEQNVVLDAYLEDIIYLEYDYVYGNSALYKLNENSWKPISGPYAELIKTDYGFLAIGNSLSQRIEGYLLDYAYAIYNLDSLNALLENSGKQYQLLNQLGVPFSYQGQVEFEEIISQSFGYHIFYTRENSILISLSGQLISEEHFDFYSLENGKIKGYSPALLLIDDFGDEVYDENDNPVYFQQEKLKYFERLE